MKKIIIFILILIFNTSCNAKINKNLENLINNFYIERSGSMLHRWNEEFYNSKDIIVTPPFIQLFFLDIYSDNLIENVYDYSKKELIKERSYTNFKEYFNVCFKNDSYDIVYGQYFNGSYFDINNLKSQIQKELLPYINIKNIRTSPVKINLGKITIYMAGNRTLKYNKDRYFFEMNKIQFFVKTKKGIYVIEKDIETKSKNMIFPYSDNVNPLKYNETTKDKKTAFFLNIDIDKNGINELIGIAGGPDHHKDLFTYNIFDFTKLVEYLKDNDLLIE